ncbi:GMC oxidoreductase [Laetiporus sulphureus 93-53]|uniref:GMC oxidoreductase n=1 Tax=Laetiporus sulphureus 93-53 TaxID=1314785 RepID=A0A165DWQ9_9APHY|nr:GMC oxidoreductase [Laetiporus sulphureus 93-53]KZT05785.1 GMC oxidoreductase [Laetiporus sulphureus 93-53]
MQHKLPVLSDVAGISFDYVIIGGGTAGLALANRLSENPRVSIAVLEAGKAHIDDPLITKPDGWLEQFMNPEYDWAFPVVPQTHAGGQSMPWNRGKGLGGSSAMNLMGWTRPQHDEFDAIERLGNLGWNFDRFCMYSQKSERFMSPDVMKSQKDYRDLFVKESIGTDGPIPLSFARMSVGVEYELQQSLEKNGVSTVADMLGGELLGTTKIISSIEPANETRAYSASHYLFPVLEERPNLKVLSEAYVTKIVTQKESEEIVATNVEFEHGGALHRVHVRLEVILSAGTIKSPNILELSGIGDRAILEPLGIPVVHNLPAVGTNIQDHVTHPGLVFDMRGDRNIVTGDLMKDSTFQDKLKELYPDAVGPLSLAWTSITYLSLQGISDRADTIISMQAAKVKQGGAEYPPGLNEQYQLQLELLRNPQVPDVELMLFPFSPFRPNTSGIPRLALLPVLSHPFSRGTIHISSADPKAAPIIDPHYYEQEVDLEIMLEGLKFARNVSQTEPFKDLISVELLPGPNVTDENQLREHVRARFGTAWHAVGSLSMSPKDKGGVVDPNFKIYGTKNIRVVDLSIFPLEPAAHPQVLAYGIAEMAADVIKGMKYA